MTILKSKKFLVTGGAGFIGSWICESLLNDGAHITCLDNYSTGLKSNIAHLICHQRFAILEGNIEEMSLDDHFDFVLHFASRASPEEYQRHPVETLKVNAVDTIRLLEYAKKHGSTLMYASSSEIYGNAQVLPTPETYNGNVNPIGAKSSYQESKRFAESVCMAYNQYHNVDVRIPRIFNTYGERLRPDGLYGRVISRFIMQALTDKEITVHGDGKQTRSFCYISDISDALRKMLEKKETSGIVVNIGNHREMSILALANLIKEMCGSRSKISFIKRGADDADRRCPDIRTAMRILEWQPKISLEEGLHRTIAWIKYFIENQEITPEQQKSKLDQN